MKPMKPQPLDGGAYQVGDAINRGRKVKNEWQEALHLVGRVHQARRRSANCSRRTGRTSRPPTGHVRRRRRRLLPPVEHVRGRENSPLRDYAGSIEAYLNPRRSERPLTRSPRRRRTATQRPRACARCRGAARRDGARHARASANTSPAMTSSSFRTGRRDRKRRAHPAPLPARARSRRAAARALHDLRHAFGSTAVRRSRSRTCRRYRPRARQHDDALEGIQTRPRAPPRAWPRRPCGAGDAPAADV